MLGYIKRLVKQIPFVGNWTQKVYWSLSGSRRPPGPFPGSELYWENRYTSGGNSGVGSYGKFADFKAEIINDFVATRGVTSVIEFGCGDGNQLMLSRYPKYLGLDVSEAAIARCRLLFAGDNTKTFELTRNYRGQTADLALSLDVIYHLIEDELFENYMHQLFAASDRFVIIYSSDTDDNRGYEKTHVRHRAVSAWIMQNLPAWRLIQHIPNKYPYKGDYREGSFAEFFSFEATAERKLR
jgi:hypothetical protein